jgi:hypothetical protein
MLKACFSCSIAISSAIIPFRSSYNSIRRMEEKVQ